ncbi:MAG TPA: hypothetical protein VKP66_16650 [Steroidobacteraceae bacterium]|nr:hypothetical protein [Steroidobacteraceae bacterium]
MVVILVSTMASFIVPPGTALGAAPPPAATNPKPASDADPFPITVRVLPGVVLVGPAQGGRAAGGSGGALTMSGSTMPAGERAVSIAIQDENGAAVDAQQVKPDAKGNFSVGRPAPSKAGTYQVTATAPDGRGTAQAKFRAIEPTQLGAQVDSAMIDAAGVAEDAVAGAQAQIEAQVDSPAKDKAKKKLDEARQALHDLRNVESHGSLNGLIGAISSDAALAESLRPKLGELTTQVNEMMNETERVKSLTAEMSKADLGCHQLVFVTEVFKGISALLNVKKRVLDTAIGLAKDVDSDLATNKAKSAGASPALAFLGGQVVKNLPELTSASKLSGNAYGIMADAGAFVSDTVFGMYCEQLTGPVEGIMNARFFESRGGNGPTLWWSYNYKISGRIVLYYPKSAKGGTSIRMNGRIEGYAHGFETWEDALTVTFPKLMSGAMQYKHSFPPVEAGGNVSQIASQGSAPLSAYVEGSAAGLLVPNSFLISVTGVLEKNAITIVLGPAKSDISPVHRVTVLILSPLTGGLGPQITWYPLPFQKVRNFIDNAASGEAMKLPLTTSGDNMTAESVFTGKVDKQKAKADYTLKIKACNPGC